MLGDFAQNGCKALSDTGNVRELALGVGENVGNALGIAFDRGGAVAVTANAETILTRDLHQIGGFVEDAREFTVLQESILLKEVRSQKSTKSEWLWRSG